MLPLVWDRFLISGRVVLVAVLFAAMVAVPAGMIAAWKQNKAPDLFLVGTATLLVSIPTFWLGLLLLIFFGLKLQWLPVVGYVSIGDDWKAGLLYLVMPIATLFLHEIGVLMRMARASTLEVLRLDYITHARAKGLSEFAVLTRHAFRNAFGPTWTLIGWCWATCWAASRRGNGVHDSRPGPSARGFDLRPRLSRDPGLPAVRGRGLRDREPADRSLLSPFRPESDRRMKKSEFRPTRCWAARSWR